MALSKRRSATSASAPPATDTGGPSLHSHFRNLVKVTPVALVVALLAGIITLLVINSADDRYEVTATAQIDAQIPVVSGDAYLFQNSAPYLALASSGEVHQEIAQQMGGGWTASMVGDDITVAVSKSPLLLEVTASAPTPDDAVKLARTTIDVLDQASREQRSQELDRAVADQNRQREALEAQIARTSPTDPARPGLRLRLTDIQGQISRILDGGVNGLSSLSVPDVDDAVQTSPRSPALAFFVALASYVIVAELLVFGRGRFGRGMSVAYARGVGKAHTMAVETTAAATLPPVTYAVISRYWSHHERTLVVATPAATQAAADLAHELPEAISVTSLSGSWPTELDDSVVQVVVIVRVAEPVRNELKKAVAVIRELGLAGRIVVVVTPDDVTSDRPDTIDHIADADDAASDFDHAEPESDAAGESAAPHGAANPTPPRQQHQPPSLRSRWAGPWNTNGSASGTDNPHKGKHEVETSG